MLETRFVLDSNASAFHSYPEDEFVMMNIMSQDCFSVDLVACLSLISFFKVPNFANDYLPDTCNKHFGG